MSIHVMLTGDEERVGAPLEVARGVDRPQARQRHCASFEGMSRQVDGIEQVAITRRASRLAVGERTPGHCPVCLAR